MAELKKMIGVWIPASQHRLIDEVAAAEGIPISELIRRLIDPEDLAKRLAAAELAREVAGDADSPPQGLLAAG